MLSIAGASSGPISVVVWMRFAVDSTVERAALPPAPDFGAPGRPTPPRGSSAARRPNASRTRPSPGRRTIVPSRFSRWGPHGRARQPASAGNRPDVGRHQRSGRLSTVREGFPTFSGSHRSKRGSGLRPPSPVELS